MPGLAGFEIGGPGNRRARRDQIGGVQLLGAVFALVAAGAVVFAIGAGSLDKPVRQVAAVGGGVELGRHNLADQPPVGEAAGKMLGEPVVLGSGGATEPVETDMEPVAELLLAQVHRGAVFGDRQIRLGGGEFRRRAVLVGGADMQDLVSAKPQIAGIGIRGQHRADQIAEMLDAVDVGQGRSDQVTCHADSDRVPSRAGRRKREIILPHGPAGCQMGLADRITLGCDLS